MIETSFNVFLWLVVLLSLSFVLNNLWKKILSGKKYYVFLIPGIMIHELSHALACRLVGAKIDEINLFSQQGGHVKYRSPKLPILGDMFIGFAPILGGIGVLLFFSWLFGLQITTIQELPSFIMANWLNWQFWIFIYLIISIIICLAPSKQDIKNALGGILVIFILGIIFHKLGFFPQFLGIILNQYLGNVLTLSAIFGFLAIIFTLPIYFFRKNANISII